MIDLQAALRASGAPVDAAADLPFGAFCPAQLDFAYKLTEHVWPVLLGASPCRPPAAARESRLLDV